jgi:O-antigen ligase
LQIVTETGFVGLALFVLLVASTGLYWWSWRKRSLALRSTFVTNALAAALMGFVQLGLSMLLQDTFFTPRTYLLFGMLLATVLIARACFSEEQAHRHPAAPAVDAEPAPGGAGGASPRP